VKAELSQAGIEYDERDFFAEPFTVEELREIIGTRPVSEFFSWRSPSFRKMGLSRDDLRDDRLLQLMVDEPRLIRRPMILTGDGDLIVGTDKKAIAALVG
jgi:arsenate reductase-like glutaredoxin family protein